MNLGRCSPEIVAQPLRTRSGAIRGFSWAVCDRGRAGLELVQSKPDPGH